MCDLPSTSVELERIQRIRGYFFIMRCAINLRFTYLLYLLEVIWTRVGNQTNKGQIVTNILQINSS